MDKNYIIEILERIVSNAKCFAGLSTSIETRVNGVSGTELCNTMSTLQLFCSRILFTFFTPRAKIFLQFKKFKIISKVHTNLYLWLK